MPIPTSQPPWIRSAGCTASGSSPSPRPGMPGCWAGWAGSGRCAWSGSRAPAATAPAWPATCPPLGCGSSRWTARTGRTAAVRASPTRRTPAAPPVRPRPGAVVGYHTRIALRELGRRAEFLDSQILCLDALIVPLVTGHAPGLIALHGVGADTAALLLVAAGDHPERLRSEAAWAHLCAVAPIPASSGKTVRRRLNPAGDRQANHALCRIVITRMSSHPPTRAYVARPPADGLSKKEIMRCLKRYVA